MKEWSTFIRPPGLMKMRMMHVVCAMVRRTVLGVDVDAKMNLNYQCQTYMPCHTLASAGCPPPA